MKLQTIFEMTQFFFEENEYEPKNKKKKKGKTPSIRNFVAKHAQSSGAGAHEDKQGKNASRARQKAQWKREQGM